MSSLLSSKSESITATRRPNALPPPPKEVLARTLRVETISVEWLAGDGSDRCYYRLSSDELSDSFVLMQLSGSDAEALKSDGYDWIKVANILASYNIPVPRLCHAIPDYAALIIEDYGDVMLESRVLDAWDQNRKSEIEAYYLGCFQVITKLIQIPANANEVWCKRAFDVEKYSWELNFFFDQYLSQVLKTELPANERDQFRNEVLALSKFLGSFSKFFVHRDFHSRNIMVKDQKLALIDFQDARLGAASYDLGSLVFDNYVPIDFTFRKSLLDEGMKVIKQALDKSQQEALQMQYKAVILQRQIKAIGTYGFLTFNKKRGNYLKYVAPALSTLRPELIYDPRWPFLSEKLIAILQKNLPNDC